MSAPAVTVTPQTSIEEAAALVVGRGFAALPVVGEDGVLVGLVAGEELLLEELRARRTAHRVEDAMSSRVYSRALLAFDLDGPVVGERGDGADGGHDGRGDRGHHAGR